MNSMTGFGRGKSATRSVTFFVELSAVNSRYLDLTLRLPRPLTPLESKVREYLSAKINRGQLTVTITVEGTDQVAGLAPINSKAAAFYIRQLKDLQKQHHISGDITVHDLLLIPEVLKSDREEIDMDATWKGMEKALDKAIDEFNNMRKKEGTAMAADMRARLKLMNGAVGQVKKLTSNAVVVYRAKLANRIAELTESKDRSTLRLEEEIAYFAERTDVTEECTRLMSHIEQYETALKAKEPVGKRLNFILQEMNREANTIGSKCADFDITAQAITLKEEIEKLRELAQNVE